MRHQLDFLFGEPYSANNPPDIRIPDIRQDIYDVINWLQERITIDIKLEPTEVNIIDFSGRAFKEYFLKITYQDRIHMLGLISASNDPDQALRDMHVYYKISVNVSTVETKFIHPERQPQELKSNKPPEVPVGDFAFTLFGHTFFHVVKGDPRALNTIFDWGLNGNFRKVFVNDPSSIFGGGTYYVKLS